MNSHAAIQITDYAWKEAGRKLAAREPVPPSMSFALDAAYFAERDPLRAIIMACAAWETALRTFLVKTVSPRVVRDANFPALYEF
jgi:hypothetical protein